LKDLLKKLKDKKMRKNLIIFATLLCLLIFNISLAHPDIVILKNGQVLNDVTVKDEGDILFLESSEQSFYINKSAVENIIKTGQKNVPAQIKNFLKTFPDRAKNFASDYFNFVAVIICLLILLAGLLMFKFLWVNIKAVSTRSSGRRATLRAIKQLDPEEKSILREFEIQASNTIDMPVEDTIVSGLIHKGILETTSEKGQYAAGGLFLPLTLSPIAKKRIKPKKIGMPSNINDERERERLAKSRPRFMYEMAEFYQSLEKNRHDFR